MKLSELNPHIRFAEEISCGFSGKTEVFVRDCRMFYILDGTGEIKTENQTFKLKKDCLFFCRENSTYKICSDALTLISLDFDLTQKRAYITSPMPPIPVKAKDISFEKTAESITDCVVFDSFVYTENGKEYLEPINIILAEHKTQKMFYRETSSSHLKTILVKLARNQISPPDDLKNAVSETINYINLNFENDITNKNIAKLVGYHPYHLNRLFLKHTGQSIHKYVLTRRIEEAKRLLLNSTLNLTDIAERVGFNSTSHFSSYFKQVVGLSPYRYRANFQKIV